LMASIGNVRRIAQKTWNVKAMKRRLRVRQTVCPIIEGYLLTKAGDVAPRPSTSESSRTIREELLFLRYSATSALHLRAGNNDHHLAAIGEWLPIMPSVELFDFEAVLL